MAREAQPDGTVAPTLRCPNLRVCRIRERTTTYLLAANTSVHAAMLKRYEHLPLLLSINTNLAATLSAPGSNSGNVVSIF
jgi:hypothetical protein